MTNETYFEFEDDVVIKYTPVIGTHKYKAEVVMTKEIFQECYKRWIEPQESKETMTREEAIEILKKYKTESKEDYYVKRVEALELAIKALE